MTPTKIQFDAFQGAFDYFNKELFNNTLPPVILNFSRRARAYGFFAPQRWSNNNAVTHEISLNPSLIKRPMAEVYSTLVHEMCHLQQEIFGKPGKSGYHNSEWSKMMEKVGLMPSSTGAEGGKKTGPRISHYIVKGGVFEQAFNNIPKEYLLPWSCSDLELKKANQQPRSAYKCEPCKVSVSGKPEQLIKCGNCGSDLLELVKVPNGI